MKLSLVVEQLRANCAVFEGRVGGAAEFKPLPDVAKLAVPAAYVIPLHDTTGEQKSQTDYWQEVTDGFSVVVALNNQPDERGQTASFDAYHQIRAFLFKTLLGWQPGEEYTFGIEYGGGVLLDMNRALLYYKYDFYATFELGEEDTWQWEDLKNLPWLKTVHVDVDLIDPSNGPDGNIEFQSDIKLKTPDED
ncbi:phage tail terminator protein [Rahnella aceris]|uniref:phage tail terminator protein n=1 Tax=Rahnella sp. (strain Y9602) TaxID=2703885 RepID=UPI001C26FE22|nr:hypothetical protein [Rahnella aceris]MBU9866815.1 hypothetical protein [Rahnella aceris]